MYRQLTYVQTVTYSSDAESHTTVHVLHYKHKRGALASHNIVRFDDTQIEGSVEKETITGLKQAP